MELNTLQQHDLAQLAGYERLIGIDEAGRGALAGPVVAAACVLEGSFFESPDVVKKSLMINDSKRLSAAARAEMFQLLDSFREGGLLDFAVGAGSVREIAELNVLGATRLAMQRALETLSARADCWALPVSTLDGPLFASHPRVRLIIDGRPLKPFPYTHQGVIQGDAKSFAIAAASIVAKVTRDKELVHQAAKYPHYRFEGHKGYGTRSHCEAILTHGACPIHRQLFLRKILRW